MKELSIEEKAKRYDESLEKARKLKDEYNDIEGYYPNQWLCEELFPELCESEDERIRKELIKETKGCEIRLFETVTNDEFIAWLEKQGKIIKEWSEMKINNIQTELQEMVELKQKTEQGEQKPVGCPEYCVMSNCANCPYHPVLIKNLNEWNEEDEKNLRVVVDYLIADNGLTLKHINWLKSLKDRVQPQQQWNYNDEIIIGTIIQEIEKIPSEKFIDNAKNRCLDWLRYRTKSLRPQNTWKPSNEQMQVLHWSMPLWIESKPKAILESLINDLKKLREK